MGLSNIEVKKQNRNSVLRYMLKAEAAPKNMIAEALGLSIPTVAQGIRELEEKGLVKEEGVLESMGGRKAKSYRCIRDAKLAIGLDITANHVNVVVINLAMEVLYTKRVQLRLKDDETSYEKLKNVVFAAIGESGINQKDILGLGISLPAIIDETGTQIYAMHEQMKISYKIHEIAAKRFSFPVLLENDANCGGKAEYHAGGTSPDCVYFFVSQSVGGAVMVEGKACYGRSRRLGEFGHMTLVPGGRICYCGRQGCVNGYCSTKLLSDRTGGNLGEFFEGLKAGREDLKKVWDEYLDHLALAIHNLIMAFDYDLIIGGYLGQYIDDYMEELGEKIRKLDPYLKDMSFLKPAVYKYEASAVGAALIFIEKFVSRI